MSSSLAWFGLLQNEKSKHITNAQYFTKRKVRAKIQENKTQQIEEGKLWTDEANNIGLQDFVLLGGGGDCLGKISKGLPPSFPYHVLI